MYGLGASGSKRRPQAKTPLFCLGPRSEDAENAFKVINEAYDVLSNPMKRSAYDLNGEEGLHELHVDETTAAAHAAAISSSTESTDLREKAARTTEISPGEAQDMFERLFGARKLRAMFAGACQQEEGSYMDATCRPQSTFARSCREPQVAPCPFFLPC